MDEGGAVAVARLLTARAHGEGLAVAQTNTGALAPHGRKLGFDSSVAESCQVHTAANGRRVIEVEYTDDGPVAVREACASRRGQASISLRDRDLTLPGRPGSAYASC